MGRCADSVIFGSLSRLRARTADARRKLTSTQLRGPHEAAHREEKLDHDTYAKHRRTLTRLPSLFCVVGAVSVEAGAYLQRSAADASHPEKSGGRARGVAGSAGVRSKGIVSRALAPFPPGAFSRISVPPWPSAICLQRARPMPLPPGLVV